MPFSGEDDGQVVEQPAGDEEELAHRQPAAERAVEDVDDGQPATPIREPTTHAAPASPAPIDQRLVEEDRLDALAVHGEEGGAASASGIAGGDGALHLALDVALPALRLGLRDQPVADEEQHRGGEQHRGALEHLAGAPWRLEDLHQRPRREQRSRRCRRRRPQRIGARIAVCPSASHVRQQRPTMSTTSKPRARMINADWKARIGGAVVRRGGGGDAHGLRSASIDATSRAASAARPGCAITPRNSVKRASICFTSGPFDRESVCSSGSKRK
jgi:hypothetical protein